MGQGDSARDFVPGESMEYAGILCVFLIFHTARLGQKIRRSPQFPLCGVALEKYRILSVIRNTAGAGAADQATLAPVFCVLGVKIACNF